MARNRSFLYSISYGLALIGSALAADDPAPRFTITNRKTDDKVEVRGDKDKVVFDVKSPSGISRAVIGRPEAWPKKMVLRLHLGGLEKLRVSNPKHSLSASVSVRAGNVEVRRWKDDKEEAGLDPQDPLWTDIRFFDRDGKTTAAVPFGEGFIEVTLPPALFEDNPRGVTLEWIDFYRN